MRRVTDRTGDPGIAVPRSSSRSPFDRVAGIEHRQGR